MERSADFAFRAVVSARSQCGTRLPSGGAPWFDQSEFVSSGRPYDERRERQNFERLIADAFAAPDVIDRPALKAAVRARLAKAPFSTEEKPLAVWARPKGPDAYVGLPNPANPSMTVAADTIISSLPWHVLKHTVDGCWDRGTTPDEYLEDVRAIAATAELVELGQEYRPYPKTYTGRVYTLICLQAATATPAGQRVFSRINGSLDRAIILLYDATPGRGVIMTAYCCFAAQAEAVMANWKPRIKL